MSVQEYKAPESVGRLQTAALAVGIVALIVGIVLGLHNQESLDNFFRAYLMGYMLILGFALGSLGLLMLQHLTSGQWGIMIRRPLESATRTIPLLFVLFLPIFFFGMEHLYGAWLDPAKVQAQPLSKMQVSWLTQNGYRGRALIYFFVWFLLMFLFNRWSRQQDVDREDRALRQRFKMVAGPGIILYVFTLSFAAIDWVMSISPHWASTIYGFLFVAGQLISSMALMAIIVVLLARTGPLAGLLHKRHLWQFGGLLFAFNMLWAYFSFSQLLIIWSGNLPEEITFYRTRLYGSWGIVAIVVLIFHFFVPFFLLLSKDLKRNQNLLPKVAMWMIFMRLVDLYWLTQPEFYRNAGPNPLDFVLPVALFGLWLGYFAWNLKREPLLPLGDPKLAEAIAAHEH
ncbi:MAG TPA: hypothetical protein VKF79_13095 [Candidatus Acidoferrum sp.]|nr:hypothetical protein [Candidatus Acidoferrum sp.]